jgi:DNA invertase Pin-like site-specific DNA recombinase
VDVTETTADVLASVAEARFNRITKSLQNGFGELKAALEARDWQHLDFCNSATEYVQILIAGIPQLDPAQRAELVNLLRAEGESTRAIAAATGTSQSTVARTIRAHESRDSRARLNGADGKPTPRPGRPLSASRRTSAR